jgi:catechol 1,2-dioxygenase
MTNVTYDNLTATVIAATGADTEPRTRELMTSLITHMHEFIKETRWTLPEFIAACRFLVRAGQISDDKRDEFILMANILGLEVLIDLIAHDGNPQTTVLGPMYRENAPDFANGDSIVVKMPADGELTLLEGTVRGADGQPLAGATIDVWEPSTNGLYENQDPEQPDMNLRGRFETDENGHYALRCLRLTNYPIPADGPGGDLLTMLGRNPMRTAHIHFIISAHGHEPIIAQLYDSSDEYLDKDSIFAVKDALVVNFEPAPADLDVAFVVRYDWSLKPNAAARAA